MALELISLCKVHKVKVSLFKRVCYLRVLFYLRSNLMSDVRTPPPLKILEIQLLLGSSNYFYFGTLLRIESF